MSAITIEDKEYIPKYSSDITLGDMGKRDKDNFEHLMKQAETKEFPSHEIAFLFQLQCMNTILAKHGVKIHQGAKAEKIDTLLKKHSMRIEHRDDTYLPVEHRGLYIYKGNQEQLWKENEIVAFISDPYKNQIIITPTFYITFAKR